MPDPLSALPYSICLWCIELAIHENPSGLLELTMVSQSWQSALLDSPLLWTQIHFQNEEDEIARVCTFLYLSRRCRLDVDITTMLPAADSLTALLRPHIARIKTIRCRPYTLHPTTSLHHQQWQRTVSYILATLSQEIKPSDVTEIVYVGTRHHADVMQFRIARSATRRVVTSERNGGPAEPSHVQEYFDIWNVKISGIIDETEEILDRFDSATTSRYDQDMERTHQNRASGRWVLSNDDARPEESMLDHIAPQCAGEDPPSFGGACEAASAHVRRDPFILMNCRFQGELVPNKGWGYRAVTPIPKNAFVLQEPPLFSCTTYERREGVLAALQAMKQSDKRHYADLSIAPSFAEVEGDMGRFQTNALRMGRNDHGKEISGVFLLGSRFNHSCQPNLHYFRNGKEIQFRAIRNIVIGEELCLSYDAGMLLMPTYDRQVTLQKYGIAPCMCSACVWGTAISDIRRRSLREIVKSIPSTDISNPRSIRYAYVAICNALNTLHEEGLYHYRDNLFYDGYRLCQRANDTENSRYWLASALDAATNMVGEDDPRVQHMWGALQKLEDLLIRPNNITVVGMPPDLSLQYPAMGSLHCSCAQERLPDFSTSLLTRLLT